MDGTGNARPVAIKLLRFQSQYLKEVHARLQNFDDHLIMPILRTHEREDGDACATVFDGSGMLTKDSAESFWAIVMPLADRNLFVAIKQERFAGVDMDQVGGGTVEHRGSRPLSFIHFHQFSFTRSFACFIKPITRIFSFFSF